MRSLSTICFSSCLLLIEASAVANPRIIGGTRVKPEEGPWMAALVYTNETAIKGQYCGGTLIHPSWLLTAGHCTKTQSEQDLKPEEITVLLGTHNLRSEEVDAGERTRVTQIIRHPEYDGSDLNRPPLADIALLKLEHPYPQPILQVAASYSQLTDVGVRATVMGWGSTSKYGNDYPDNLLQAVVPITSNAVCNGPRSYPGMIQNNMLCAGYQQGGTDACVGDSGGPLIVPTNNGWRQVGIVSYGEGCAQPNYYGVYTRISSFQEFISENICSATDTPAAPTLAIKTEGQVATASWPQVTGAQGYQLYYGPTYPCQLDDKGPCIYSFDVGIGTSLTATLNRGTSLYVAIQAYQGNCYSPYSNIELVTIP
jgi:secreted trypsin-like serine protease